MKNAMPGVVENSEAYSRKDGQIDTRVPTTSIFLLEYIDICIYICINDVHWNSEANRIEDVVKKSER